jgi:hypothetical protein
MCVLQRKEKQKRENSLRNVLDVILVVIKDENAECRSSQTVILKTLLFARD